jgi:7,8-dihydropterin-6-yl-methyl-4-(beta-D-ribofuranosyl)aminobenzene 5'-phosphate synthase
MKITILCNDKARRPFFSEHGFSALVETEECSVLFDTGSTDVFLKNMGILNLNPSEIENVVLSHGHYDHVGGLRYLSGKGYFQVRAKSSVFLPNYSGKRFAGIDWERLKGSFQFGELERNVQKICGSVFAWGPAPMVNDFEEPDPKFQVIQSGEKMRNFFEEELNLVIDREQGLILLTGCAHRGIANIAYGAQSLFGERINMIVGGFHLFNASLERIQRVIAYFNEIGVEKLMPCHCTGERAIKLFRRKFKGEVLTCEAGTEIVVSSGKVKGAS